MMTNMILIEENFNGIEVLEETYAPDKKRLYLSGCFMESEVKNRNGRIYEKSDMEAAVDKINSAAEQKQYILGHLDHPNHLDIRLEDAAMKLTSARMVGNQVHCKAEVLEKTPKGAILRSLIESGVNVGVSSRGGGTVNESTGRVSNYRFVTVDAVGVPSCRSSYPETIREQLEMYKRGEQVIELSEALMHDPIAQKYFEIEMKKFIETLRR